MRRFLLLATFLMLLPSSLLAQQVKAVSMPAVAGRLVSLEAGGEVTPWDAVGRLRVGEAVFCTATLIAADLALTAAHCLFDPVTGERQSDQSMRFDVGLNHGTARAVRAVRRSVIRSDFDYGAPKTATRVARDVALLELDSSVSVTEAFPIAPWNFPEDRQDVRVVSYDKNQTDSPMEQRWCYILQRMSSVYVSSCGVEYGASGAPLILMQNGQPRVVGVITAKATLDGHPVSLSAGLSTILPQLLRLAQRGSGDRLSAQGQLASR